MNSLLDDTNSSIVGNLHGSMGASVRFLFNPRMALRTEMGVHFIGGDTGGVKDFYPHYVDQVGTARRFYRHSGTIFDLAALYELNFFSYAYRPGYQATGVSPPICRWDSDSPSPPPAARSLRGCPSALA